MTGNIHVIQPCLEHCTDTDIRYVCMLLMFGRYVHNFLSAHEHSMFFTEWTFENIIIGTVKLQPAVDNET